MTERLENELCHFTYVTTHSPILPSLYLRHSSFSHSSVASPTSKLVLQPFFRFSYVTNSSFNSPGKPSMVTRWTQDNNVARGAGTGPSRRTTPRDGRRILHLAMSLASDCGSQIDANESVDDIQFGTLVMRFGNRIYQSCHIGEHSVSLEQVPNSSRCHIQ